jgi:hypothetical protein
MAHTHRLYGSYPPWGKSVEFSAGGGGNAPLVFDLTEYWTSKDWTIPVTDEIISAVLSCNIVFKQAQNEDGVSTVKYQAVLDCSVYEQSDEETGDYRSNIVINENDHVGLFGTTAVIDLTTKELKIILPK